MKKFLSLASVVSLLFLMNCASNIRTKNYTESDLGKFKTFAYLPSTSFNTKEFGNNVDTKVEESLINILNDKMIEKGYSLNTTEPDLLVLLATSNQIKSNLKNNRNNYQDAPTEAGSASNSPNFASTSSTDYKRYLGNSDEVLLNKAYKSGSLIVEVFNSKTKELVWIGIAEDFKAHISDQTLMSRMINEIFKEFPN